MKNPIRKSGLAPGSVVFTGNRKVEKVLIHHMVYDEKDIEYAVYDNQSEFVFHESDENRTDWYAMRGIYDPDLIQLMGKTFHIHPLVLEDTADVFQRPKFEAYDNGLFVSIRALSFNMNSRKINSEQITLFFRKGLLISFQEDETDLFESVRQRIHNRSGRIRSRGADYLAYALVDCIVDQYYTVMEELELVIEGLEDKLIEESSENIKSEIHHLKKELVGLRKSVFPLREAISKFGRIESPMVHDSTLLFVRDLYDHIIQIMDMVESYRDLLNGLQDLWISEVSFKMNKVMQLLTLISTIFIPLTFLTGIYGMNFTNMPELQWQYGYFVLLGVIGFIFFAILYYFKRMKWL